MKRIIMMLALTALLVVVLSMSALSAFAANCPGKNPNCNGPGKSEDASGTPPVVHFDPGSASGRR